MDYNTHGFNIGDKVKIVESRSPFNGHTGKIVEFCQYGCHAKLHPDFWALTGYLKHDREYTNEEAV
jgi:hypothetical protein